MSKNDITGDRLVSKTPTDAYRDNFDLVFKKKPRTGCHIITAQQLVDNVEKALDERAGCQGGKCKHASDCAIHDSESDGRCDCDESWPFEYPAQTKDEK